MGRYVRSVVRDLAAHPGIAVTLLVRDLRRAREYRELIAGADVAPLSAARTRRDFAVIWYPWNGMRFAARPPSVVTINDDFAFRYPAAGRIARWREQRPIQRAAERATHIMTISDWSRQMLSERFRLMPSRISVIPLAPDAMFTPGVEPSPYAEPFVLAVGTREERKNIAFLIDVFTRAFPDRDVRLVLVGELDEALRRRARATGLPIDVVAGVDDARLLRLYRTAGVVAVPSLAEGFGLVAAEAQACGATVIAANTSALPEAVGDAGILLDPTDHDGWIIALRAFMRRPAGSQPYRANAIARWPAASRERMKRAVLTVLQSTIDNLP